MAVNETIVTGRNLENALMHHPRHGRGYPSGPSHLT